MQRFNSFKLIALSAVFFAAQSAFSHITLEQPQVESGASYKAALRVGHGCDGLSTTAIRVRLPAGFQGAKPMPKAGWMLQTVIEKLAAPYDNHGKPVLEDVVEITWTVKSPEFALKDSEYDEFVFRGRAALPAGPAWFRVSQMCQDGSKIGSNAWTEVPSQGSSTQGLKYPAALLNVITPKTTLGSGAHAGHKH